MKKIIVIIPIIIAIIGLIVVSESNNEVRIDKAIFHVTLADPEMYQDGVYTDMFSVEAGNYFFRFIPNGDSPKSLSISLNGKNLNFYEDFRLNGTLHETGISQYYTWDYDGQKQVVISEQQEITIEINPNGSILGSVSVSILQN